MKNTLRVVGYTRVSTLRQSEEGESLKTQEAAIRRYCDAYEDLKLTKIYCDAGISGGTTAKRPALLNLLRDKDKIDLVLVNDLSRLGRNTRELLNNVEELRKAGVEIRFLQERMDISTDSGSLTFQILSAVAEFMRKSTAQATQSNKISRCSSGVPATGKLPWGRTFDKQNGVWGIDQEKRQVFEKAVVEFINGGSLREIGARIPKEYNLSYGNLYKLLKTAAGSKWTVKIKTKPLEDKKIAKIKTVVFDVPPLIDPETLAMAEKRLTFNRTNPRIDTESKEIYLLRGYLRCWYCGKVLCGQISKNGKYRYGYYRHAAGKFEKCKAVTYAPIKSIEIAVLKVIWENTMDEDGFDEAIRSKFPSPEKRLDLMQVIERREKELLQLKKDKDKLVDALLRGVLSEQTIKSREVELIKQETFIEKQLSQDRENLSKLENQNEIELRLRSSRNQMLAYFSSWEHFATMGFKERRRLIHSTFGNGGWSEDGIPYGVYMRNIGKHKHEYRIVAVLFEGEQILYKDDYDYYDPNDPEIPDMLDRSDFLSNKANGLYKMPERPESID